MPYRPRRPKGPRTMTGRRPAVTTVKTTKVVKRRKPAYRSKAARSYNPLVKFNTNNPFRTRFTTKLVYTSTHTMADKGAGGYQFGTKQRYSLNSLYDPDVTSTGHQPYCFDQVAAIYGRYKVSGCLVELFLTDPNSDSLVVGTAVVNPSNSAFNIEGYGPEALRELPQCGVTYLPNSGSQSRHLKYYVPLHTAFNWSRKQYSADMDNTTAAVTGSPGSQAYLDIAVANIRGGDSSNLIVRTRLTYYCTFYSRKFVAAS